MYMTKVSLTTSHLLPHWVDRWAVHMSRHHRHDRHLGAEQGIKKINMTKESLLVLPHWVDRWAVQCTHYTCPDTTDTTATCGQNKALKSVK